MSILLEALRKSERIKPKHSAPTIHTETQPSVVSGSFRIVWLVVILVVAFIVSGWFIWSYYQAPDADPQPIVLQAPENILLTSGAAGRSQDASGAVPATPTLSIAGSTSAGHPRTPVESYQAPTESTSQTGSDASQTLSDSSPAKRAAGNDTGPTVLSMPASRAPVPVAVPKSAPHKPEPISYWELPDAIREEVPVIKFSVLVYAKNPKDRFVLINGQRYGEGDTMSGVHLEEIRRDGVVISYRLYKFLVER